MRTRNHAYKIRRATKRGIKAKSNIDYIISRKDRKDPLFSFEKSYEEQLEKVGKRYVYCTSFATGRLN